MNTHEIRSMKERFERGRQLVSEIESLQSIIHRIDEPAGSGNKPMLNIWVYVKDKPSVGLPDSLQSDPVILAFLREFAETRLKARGEELTAILNSKEAMG